VLSQADLYRAFDAAPDSIVAFLIWLATQERLGSTPCVADIGAGTGRLVPPLASLGWFVTAYEPDSDYFPVARAVGRAYPTVTTKHGGFEDVSEIEVFDIACGINSSYAHLLRPSQRAEALRRMARSLRPHGLLVLDLPNFPWMLANYGPAAPQEGQWEGTVILRCREHQIDKDGGTFTTLDRHEWTGPSGAITNSTKTHTYAIVAHETHLSEMALAGFRDLRLFPSFDARTPVLRPTSRLIYVARRRRTLSP
jgi:SAM-dependent methyltransferase